MTRLHPKLRPALALLALAAAAPLSAADTTIQLGNGDVFSVEDEVGTTRFSVDSNGNIFPSSVSYANTVIVSADGTAAANGTALENALAGITDASASNPYLLKLEPGIYNIGSGSLGMKEYVDIEGSGEGVTTIKNQGASNTTQAGVLASASNAEVRFLTLFSDSAFSDAAGIYAEGGADVRLLHVTLRTANSSSSAYGANLFSCGEALLEHVTVDVDTNGSLTRGLGINGCSGRVTVRDSEIATQGGSTINTGVNIFNTETHLERVNITAAGGTSIYGIQSETSDTTLKNVRAYADFGSTSSIGLELDDDFTGPVSYTATVLDSELIGSGAAVATAPETELNIASSLLDGGIQGTDNLTCAGVYDDAYTFYAGTCP